MHDKIQQGTKSEFGGFELVPEKRLEKWKPFIDFKSKLLIAKEIAIAGSREASWLARGFMARARLHG